MQERSEHRGASPFTIGVTVLAGFLGSGKTTLLRRVVADAQLGSQVAVIVNELGALGLDQELIAGARHTAALQVQELMSGCICCTLRGELGDALLDLSSGRAGPVPRHILIETSGAARASEASYAVNAVGFDAPVQTDAVITLVDAHNAARAHAEHPELFEDQVRSADLLLLNKADLCAEPAERAALTGWLLPLAPRAQHLWTAQAAIDPALLLGAVPLRGPVQERAASAVASGGGPPAAHGLTALTLPLLEPVARGALEDWLYSLADRVFRIKGIVDARDDGRVAPLLVQAVGDRVELDELPADSPLRASLRRLIFIGAAPDEDALRAGLRGLR